MRLKGFVIKKRGQALIETALVLPVIILILMGIIDFGMLFNNYLILSNASREGARQAVIGATDQVINDVISNVTDILDSTKLTVNISPSQSSRKKGDEITISLKYDYNLITPVISSIIPNPVELEAKSVMRME